MVVLTLGIFWLDVMPYKLLGLPVQYAKGTLPPYHASWLSKCIDLVLAKFGVSEFVIANLLNVTARLDAACFLYYKDKKIENIR